MLTKTWSSAIQGVDAYTVEIEVNATGAGNDDQVTVVGLPDTAVRESRERVWSAISCSGFFPPIGKTTVNLAPADVRKEGAAFDLPIALGMIAAGNGFDRSALKGAIIVGELALDGSVRRINGALPIALHARLAGAHNLLVPAENAAEAAVIQGVNVFPIRHLLEAVHLFRGEDGPEPVQVRLQDIVREAHRDSADFAEVRGQEMAKRAMEVAAASSI